MSMYPIYEIIFNNTGTAILVIEENSRISLVNSKFEELSGYTREEVEGKMEWTDFVTGSDLSRMGEYRKMRLENPDSAPDSYEFDYRDREGKIKRILINITFVPDTSQTIASLQDITEQNKTRGSLEHRLVFEKVISGISQRFINIAGSDIDLEIAQALGAIGDLKQVDRCYVFIIEADGIHFSNTHEWCAPGITPQKDSLQHQSAIEAGWTFSKLLLNENIFIHSLEDLPEEARYEKELFEAQGIQSLLIVPLFYKKSLRGFLGLDSVRKMRNWANDDFIMLRTAGDIIINAFERKRIDRKLELSERKYRDFVNFMPQVVFEVDVDGVVTFANEYAFQLFEYTKKDFDKGISLFQVIAKSEWDRVKKCMSMVFKGANSEGIEYTGVTKHGRKFPVLVYATPVYSEGKLIGIRGIIIDMTVRKMLEDQLQQSQKMEALGRLAGGIAHDFNNMLTSIMGFSALLKLDDCLTGEAGETVENIVTIAKSGANLTRQLLAFSRKEIISPKEMSINQVVEKAMKMLDRLLYENIRVTTSLAEDLHPVKADPSQVEQIVLNLVLNSQDALPDGGDINIKTKNLPAELAVDLHELQLVPRDYVVLEVIDNGYGMTDEVRGKVLEPFFTTKDPSNGTGLGLSTVYGIAKQNKGAIQIESSPGEGTTIGVYLPAAGHST